MSTREIAVLGPGCEKCRRLHERATEAVNRLGLEAAVRKVEAIEEIIAQGVMVTPALMIDGEVKSSGRVLSVEEIERLLAS